MKSTRRAVRTKRGHLVASAPPTTLAHGRPLPLAPATSSTLPASDPAFRYLLAQLERSIAKARGDGTAQRAAKRRSERARAALIATEGGLQEAQRINADIAAAAPAIRTAAKAHASTREYAERAALSFLQAIREHDITTTTARGWMLSARTWGELEAQMRDRVFALGTTGEKPAGDAGPSFAETIKLGTTSSQTARNAEGWSLHLEQQAKAAKPAALPGWFTSPPPQDAPVDVEATGEGSDLEDASTRHGGAGIGGGEDHGADEHGTDVSESEEEPTMPSQRVREAHHRATSSEPERPVPAAFLRVRIDGNAPMSQRPDGSWGPAPEGIRQARPSPEALASMREQGIAIRPEWEEP